MIEARLRLRLATAGFASFLAGLALLHLLNLNEFPRHMSMYVLRDDPWLAITITLLLGASLVLLGTALLDTLPVSTAGRWGSRGLIAAGALFALMDIFPTDPGALPVSLTGKIHVASVLLAIGAVCAAMLAFVVAGRSQAAWAAVTGRSFIFPCVAGALGIAWGLGDLSATYWQFASVMQRLMAVAMVGWLLLVAVRAQAVDTRQETLDSQSQTEA